MSNDINSRAYLSEGEASNNNLFCCGDELLSALGDRVSSSAFPAKNSGQVEVIMELMRKNEINDLNFRTTEVI